LLDAVNFLLQSDQSSSWTLQDVLPFVTAGMDDALGPRVRSSAVALAITIRRAQGRECVEPLLAGLRPAVQTVLRERFLEVEDEEDDFTKEDFEQAVDFVPPSADILAGLMVCGSAIVGPKHATTTLLPGSISPDDEDMLMDGILEETGAVFGMGSATPNFGASKPASIGASTRAPTEVSVLDDPGLLGLIDEPHSYNHTSRSRTVKISTAVEVC
jgi:hypothetical protein